MKADVGTASARMSCDIENASAGMYAANASFYSYSDILTLTNDWGLTGSEVASGEFTINPPVGGGLHGGAWFVDTFDPTGTFMEWEDLTSYVIGASAQREHTPAEGSLWLEALLHRYPSSGVNFETTAP